MGVTHIREAFNQIAGGKATCHAALMRYEMGTDGQQRQIITLKGIKSDGATFTLSTPPHQLTEDHHVEVKKIALELLKEEPTIEVAGSNHQIVDSSASEPRLLEHRPVMTSDSPADVQSAKPGDVASPIGVVQQPAERGASLPTAGDLSIQTAGGLSIQNPFAPR